LIPYATPAPNRRAAPPSTGISSGGGGCAKIPPVVAMNTIAVYNPIFANRFIFTFSDFMICKYTQKYRIANFFSMYAIIFSTKPTNKTNTKSGGQ
jgi:hypothetical protein